MTGQTWWYVARSGGIVAWTDRTTLPLRIGVLAAVAVVCVATLIRIIQADSRSAAPQRPARPSPTA